MNVGKMSAFLRSVDAKRVCREPLHTQRTLELDFTQLSSVLLIS